MNDENETLRDYNFTSAAWESLYQVVDDARFKDRDAHAIYKALRHHLKWISFGEYLCRYIYLKAGLEGAFDQIPIKEYQMIIRSSFSDNYTPASFTPTTAKLSALSKNWLTRQTVKRNVVFLLGFGLSMSVEDVNLFLTKALRESEINPKDPFEVICWYCYKNHYNFLKFNQLWEQYTQLSPAMEPDALYSDPTVNVRRTVGKICDDASLMDFVSKLKGRGGRSVMSVTARECFDRLYEQARTAAAAIYNQEAGKNLYTCENITESDLERIISAAIPKDHHGNLTPGKASRLNRQFAGKRLSRQRIHEILSGDSEVTRFELITLNFFIFSEKLEALPSAKERYFSFLESTNEILEKCWMGQMYIQNPYECFVLMCMLSDDPLGTYGDVWEMSYDPEADL